MTTFTHKITGATLTYPQTHPLHDTLVSCDQWQAQDVPQEPAPDTPEEHEETKETGDGADSPKPAARRGRGRATTPSD
ncbi:hypothetical protein [Actinomyces faecalis]|uniref:hypothetical protein n=1 Tax=Actinomyces faecalis TaxID=2722820 RepID=UPI0015543934|nr:hypothetical protein [Actinomyces faecalis]